MSTEAPTSITSSTAAMAPKSASLPLTLILAATPSLGIGKAGQLPWPMLKSEMAYFARVTKRVPPLPTTAADITPPQQKKRINAVVMGRKTWDSIPDKFRPLKGRLNVVVTSDPKAEKWAKLAKSEEGPVVVGSVASALEALSPNPSAAQTQIPEDVEVERVFVIGGASIYKAALELAAAKRVLLTKIKSEFECDTFFPVDLEGEKDWVRKDKSALEEFAGESVPDEIEEKGVKFEFLMFEKVEG